MVQEKRLQSLAELQTTESSCLVGATMEKKDAWKLFCPVYTVDHANLSEKTWENEMENLKMESKADILIVKTMERKRHVGGFLAGIIKP